MTCTQILELYLIRDNREERQLNVTKVFLPRTISNSREIDTQFRRTPESKKDQQTVREESEELRLGKVEHHRW